MKELLHIVDYMFRGVRLDFYAFWLSYWVLGLALVLFVNPGAMQLTAYEAFREILNNSYAWVAILTVIGSLGLYSCIHIQWMRYAFALLFLFWTFTATCTVISLAQFSYAAFIYTSFAFVGAWSFLRTLDGTP